ncbi:MAG: D-alanyl-D-alanine carboxypeptidase family protein [Streptosporangiales bacterium]
MIPRRLAAACCAATTVALLAAPPAAAAPEATVGGPRLASHGVIRPEGAPRLPKVKAAAYVVSDLETGTVMAAKDPHGAYAPASTLKVLTALAVLRHLDPKQRVRPTFHDISVDGSKVGIDRRRTYRARTLLLAMLMVSANDASEAVAHAAGGSGGRARTVARMNAIARHLHADDTNARNPTGLDARGQRSSAYDLTLMFRTGMKRADFRHYLSVRHALFPGYGKQKAYHIASHNRLLTSYRGDLAGKNGYTIKAKASYVGTARRHGHTIGVAVMRDRGDLWKDTAALLDWGFRARGHAEPVGDLVPPGPAGDPRVASPSARGRVAAHTPAAHAGAGPGQHAAIATRALVLLGLACAAAALLAVIVGVRLARPRRRRGRRRR